MTPLLDVTSLIFLVVAVVVLWRLYMVLGSRTGNERPPVDPFARRRDASPPDRRSADAASDNVIRLPGAPDDGTAASDGENVDEAIDDMVPAGSALNAALRTIASADRSFDPRHFIDGAKVAYEMVVNAFASEDRDTLKSLLAPDVFSGFDNAIAERRRRGETLKTEFIGLDKTEITEASLKGGLMQITVRFVSKLVSATTAKDGTVVEGDPQKVQEVTDLWTFAREIRSRDPNWRLVATGVDG